MPEILLTTINAKWIHTSLALRLLAANLGEYKDNCVIEEFALRQGMDEKLDGIKKHNARIIGISVSIWNVSQTTCLLRELAGKDKPIIVLGGPEVSVIDSSAEIFKYADYVIKGEGEHLFRELCARLLTCSAAATAACQIISQTEPVDVTTVQQAYSLYTEEDLQKKLVYVESVRGCPYTCTFCQSGTLSSTKKCREFPLQNFLLEMDTLIKRGAARFKFLDRSFNVNTKRAVTIMNFFLERILQANKNTMFVHFEITPETIPQEMLAVMRKFPQGTLRLEIGIQTLNPHTQTLIGRKIFSGKELENIRVIIENTNAIVHADLIAGLPEEGFDSFAAGFDNLYACKPSEIQLGILKCLGGTAVKTDAEKYGIVYSPQAPYEVIQTAALPKSDMDKIKNFARFWEIIVNRGAFEDILPVLFKNESSVFKLFLKLSDHLLIKFGRNWGIDRQCLREAVIDWTKK
ncbi:MAG: hypothetical protein Ta2F_08360 [Termitinemataceae bacterium]|nr:MAG: hypothetical protein Ta2F_08360 [Termitinemataceae bacterium]